MSQKLKKDCFYNSEVEENRTPIWWHRSTIMKLNRDMLSRKKSEYGFLGIGLRFEDAPVLDLS